MPINGAMTILPCWQKFPYMMMINRKLSVVFSFRGLGEDSDGDSVEDTSSDVSSDCDHGQPIGIKSSCLVKNISADQEGFSSDDSESDNQESHPVFQYLEHDAPYGRQPLVDMVQIFFCFVLPNIASAT